MSQKKIEDTKTFRFLDFLLTKIWAIRTFGLKGYLNVRRVSTPFRKSHGWVE